MILIAAHPLDESEGKRGSPYDFARFVSKDKTAGCDVFLVEEDSDAFEKNGG